MGQHTNGADDRSAAELLLWLVPSLELRKPFDPGPAGVEVCERIGHCERICLWFEKKQLEEGEKKRLGGATTIGILSVEVLF